ncbi:MAG: HEAT repeat domain-containing protein [Planctomycetota bacterium]|jgi:HEAT repeat protein
MDGTLKKLCQMAQGDDSKLRSAALRVMGELGDGSSAVMSAVRANLGERSEELRLRALETAEKLDVLAVIDQVMPLLGDDGMVGRKAGEAVAAVGTKGLPALLKGLENASPETRRSLLGVIAGVPGARAEQALIRALGGADAVEAEGVARALSVRLGTLRGNTRRSLGDAVASLLRTRRRMAPEAIAAGLRVLGRVGDVHHRALLVEYTRPDHPSTVRREALLALAVLAPPTRGGDRILSALLRYLDEPDFVNVVQPALAAIQRMPTPASLADALQKLLEQGSPAVRRVAAEKLGEVDRAPRARALLKYFDDGDAGVQEAVAGALSKMKSGVPGLLTALEKSEDAERAWRFVRVLEKLAKHIAPAAAKRLLNVGTQRVEKAHPTARPLLYLLRCVSPRSFRANLLSRARTLLRQKKAPAADALLGLLSRDDLDTPKVRYEFAVVKLAVSRLDMALPYRESDPALREFTALIRDGAVRIAKKVFAEKVIGPAHLLYLACHFAERVDDERRFGAELLKHVASRFRRRPEGQVATAKIAAEGLEKLPVRKRAAASGAKAKPKSSKKKSARKSAKKKPAKKKAAKKKPAKKKKAAKKSAKKKPAKKKKAAKKTAKKKKPAKKK